MFPKTKRKSDRSFLDTFKDQYCLVKNKRGAEGHHIITRGAGGPDEAWNVMPLSREAHAEVHQIGLVKFAEKYPRVKRWLESNGWSFCQDRNKWVHEEPGKHLFFNCKGNACV